MATLPVYFVARQSLLCFFKRFFAFVYFQIFKLGGHHVTDGDEIRNIQWQSWTCVLGSEVNGMWPKYSQINDVNAVDASIPYDTLATGDDFGLVKLFRFPCVKKGSSPLAALHFS